MITNSKQLINDCMSNAKDRFDFWIAFINTINARNFAEIGVFRGDFAEKMLRGCDCLEKYYMLDPWRNLEEWDKPANTDNGTFELLMQRALEKTEFANNKRILLRGKTTEVIDNIPAHSLDFAYIDGDHTLRGIAIDLIRVLPKIKAGGFIGGDDFSPNELQHFPDFEPTLIFPYAIYFAEAVSARIYALPHNQFLIEKTVGGSFEQINLTGIDFNTGLKEQLHKCIRGTERNGAN